MGNRRLAYMNATDVLVIGCLILDTKSFILPMHNFARIYFQIHAEFIFCLVLRQALDLSQPKFTNKEITESLFIIIPGVAEINNVT